jgi:hypothetical protein
MVKVNDPIGMFQRMTLNLAKQRTDPVAAKSASSQASSSSTIRDRIDISTFKSSTDVQSLTKEMSGQSFKSIKDYGKYFLDAYARMKGGK